VIRALALLIAVALAAPATASNLIIMPRDETLADSYQLSVIKEILVNAGQREGIEFKVTSAADMSSYRCRRGVLGTGADSTIWDVVHHIGFGATRNGIGSTDPYYPDDLTLTGGAAASGLRKFPLKLQVFWGRMSGTKGWSNNPVCSLGTMNSALINGTAGRDTTHSVFAVGTPFIFKTETQSVQPAGGVKAGAYLRQRLNAAASLSQNICQDCDSVPSRAANDSMVVWEFAPVPPGTVLDGGQTARQILCVNDGDSSNEGGGDPGLVMAALCIADSISGGKVFERRAIEGQGRGLPRQTSAVIGYGYNNDAESFLGGSAGGIRQSSLTILKAQADSINKLRCKPTLLFEPDSLDENVWQDAVWSRITDLHYAPAGLAGRIGLASFGNASTAHPMDPFGIARARKAFGDNSGAGKDTSLHALARSAKALGVAKWGSAKVEPMIAAGGYNWAPAAASAGMTADSLYSAIAANFSSLLTGARIGSYGFGSNNLVNWPVTVRARYGFSPDSATSRALSAYGGRSLKIIAASGASGLASDRWGNGKNSTDVAYEYSAYAVSQMLIGRGTVRPGSQDIAGVTNVVTRQHRSQIFMVTAAGMGRADLGFPAGTARAGQWTYRVLKQVDMMMDLWNASAWPANRPIAEWAYPSELR
jgi:hypothetical protein